MAQVAFFLFANYFFKEFDHYNSFSFRIFHRIFRARLHQTDLSLPQRVMAHSSECLPRSFFFVRSSYQYRHL